MHLIPGKRGGRRHAKDITNEILSRLELWENGDIATLWTSAVNTAATRAARRSARIQSGIGHNYQEILVQQLVADGECSKACDCLLGEPPAEPSEQTYRALKALHPAALPVSVDFTKAVPISSFTPDEVAESFRSFRRSSSGTIRHSASTYSIVTRPS